MRKHLSYLTSNNLWTPIAIIIAAIMISCTIWHNAGGSFKAFDSDNGAVAGAPTAKAQVAVDSAKVKTANTPFVGQANAPVTVAIWTDYQCPFCKRFEIDSVRQLYSDYVGNGKVKLVFKDFAFLGPDSTTLAIAGRAVWEAAPSKYYKWRDSIYENQGQEHSGWGTKDKVLALSAKTLTASEIQRVSSLMSSKADEYQKLIDADKTEGASFGITGTPGTIIGKTYINGAQSYSAVRGAVEKALGN